MPVQKARQPKNRPARPGTPNTNFANRSVSLLCRTFWFFSMVERIFSVTVNTVSSGSRYTFREVSSGVRPPGLGLQDHKAEGAEVVPLTRSAGFITK